MNRRTFLTASATTIFAGNLLAEAKPKLHFAVKYSMIGTGKTVKDKFELIKKIGFEGVEIDSPSRLNLKEANEAQQATGIKIHGVIDSVHWDDAPPFAPGRKGAGQGIEALLGAIATRKQLGRRRSCSSPASSETLPTRRR